MTAKLTLVVVSGKKPTAPSNQYFVRIYDNFHYGDPNESSEHNSYATCAEAVAVAKQIIDKSLRWEFKSGHQSADGLYDAYTSFGEDPSVIGPYPESVFSAWDYARRRCDEMYGHHSA
jgi:hypothetical protein